MNESLEFSKIYEEHFFMNMNSNRSEFRHCSAAKDAAFLSDSVAVEE